MTAPDRLLTEQEVFDIVARHLFNQKRPSCIGDPDDEVFKYRTPDGLKDPIGILVTDDEYDLNWDHEDGGVVVSELDLPDRLTVLVKRSLLEDLVVNVHDEPENWADRGDLRDALMGVAVKYQLSADCIKDQEGPW